MRLYRFLAILGPRNKEFWRDRAALAWNFLFPIAVVVGFAIAFSGQGPDLYKVGLVEGGVQKLAFLETQYVQFVAVSEVDKAVVKVERHQLDMLLDPANRRYWVNDSSPAGYVLERLLTGGDQGLTKLPQANQHQVKITA